MPCECCSPVVSSLPRYFRATVRQRVPDIPSMQQNPIRVRVASSGNAATDGSDSGAAAPMGDDRARGLRGVCPSS